MVTITVSSGSLRVSAVRFTGMAAVISPTGIVIELIAIVSSMPLPEAVPVTVNGTTTSLPPAAESWIAIVAVPPFSATSCVSRGK